MSLRMPIPKKIREQLAKDQYMKDCIFKGFDFCAGRVEWHHGFTYAGKRQNELWCLIPLCGIHHQKAGHKAFVNVINAEIRARITHFKAEQEFREKYPRSKLLTLTN